MALGPGTRLGAYEILSLIGSGGMGEVYRAKDTKLNRDVAVKILPATFTNDPDRVARFRREAQVLASLNHPHIGAIYGLDEATGTQFLVLELVDGESLDRRIARGPIPIDEALVIAKQIAEALEAAHEKGIIHRDLKPANIALTKDGTVKVLDFGLAKAVEPSSGSIDAMNSPTITSPAMMTGVGVILGTAAYMSPEQAKGRPADKRSDVWAFGCVLYEMLSGRRAFPGREVVDTLASVLKTEPNWNALPPETPPNVRLVLQRCLDKDPRRRLQAIGDARVEIEDALGGAAEAARVAPPRRSEDRWRAIPPSVVVALTVAVAAAGAVIYLTRGSKSSASGAVTRMEIRMPPGVHFNGDAALSPDGRRVVFVGAYAGGRQLYARSLDQLDAVPLPSTATNALTCFFSPDGGAVGYFSFEGVLKRVTLADGASVTVARDVDYAAGTWGSDGLITFVRGRALWQVPASGGTPTQLTTLDVQKGEVQHRAPHAIRGGRFILFEVQSQGAQRRESHIEAVAVANGQRRGVVESGSDPDTTSSGHLLFRQGSALFAARFDPARLRTTGPAIRVMESVRVASAGGSGSLLYAEPEMNRLVWVSRQGVEQAFGQPRSGYYKSNLSPDARLIAITIGGTNSVWLYDVVRDTLTRLSEGDDPVWTPDGKRVVVSTSTGMRLVDVGAAEADQPIPRSSRGDAPSSVSPDGRVLAFTRPDPDTQLDIFFRPLEEAAPRPFVKSRAYEGGLQFSPDGRWVAYVSDESGASEIYARVFSGPGRKWQVSTHEGTEPRWSRDSRELFFRSGDKMMAVAVSNNPDNPFSKPTLLFEREYLRSRTTPTYDVAPDGRFLMIRDEPDTVRLNLVVNWSEELKQRVPTK